MTKIMYSTINNRKLMAMIYLDVAKAFNCIHHARLYHKLLSIGCSQRWFRSYLYRSQMVSYLDKKSHACPVQSGKAQGTVRGPLIFIFYIKGLVTNYRKGGYKTGGWGHVKFYPYEKGGRKKF